MVLRSGILIQIRLFRLLISEIDSRNIKGFHLLLQISSEIALLEEGDYTGEIQEVYDRRRRSMNGKEFLEKPQVQKVKVQSVLLVYNLALVFLT